MSGICGLICLESDNESEYRSRNENWKQSDTSGSTCDAATDSELSSSLVGSESSPGKCYHSTFRHVVTYDTFIDEFFTHW